MVLPRRLRLQREGRVLACFSIAHRKLLSVEIAGQPVAAGGAESCAAQFARALNRLAQLSPDLATAGAAHSPLPQFDVSPCRLPETTARCSAEQLRMALLDITVGTNTAPSVLDRAMSWARTDQTEINRTLGGDPHFSQHTRKDLGNPASRPLQRRKCEPCIAHLCHAAVANSAVTRRHHTRDEVLSQLRTCVGGNLCVGRATRTR